MDHGEGGREKPPLKLLRSDMIGMITSQEFFRLPALLEECVSGFGKVDLSPEWSVEIRSLPDIVEICRGPALGFERQVTVRGLSGTKTYHAGNSSFGIVEILALDLAVG